MARATVVLPAVLTAPQSQRELSCEAGTPLEALRAAAALVPSLAPRLLHGDRPLAGLSLNGRLLSPAEAATAALAEGDRVGVHPPVAGG